MATVAGLLAMHALSPHGTAADGEHGPLTLPAAHVGHTHALDRADPSAQTGHTDHTREPGDAHTAMMLCAAFLVAAGALLLSRLRRRTPVWWFASSLSPSRRAGPARLVSRPATGPPSVWAYSVIRC